MHLFSYYPYDSCLCTFDPTIPTSAVFLVTFILVLFVLNTIYQSCLLYMYSMGSEHGEQNTWIRYY